MKHTALVFVIGAFSSLAFAKPADLPQCKDITTACKAQGYEPGQHKKTGKGLWVDCVEAIAHGKTVANVNFSQVQAQTCATAAKGARHK